MKHKLLSILTALALCLSLCPVTALAAEGYYFSASPTAENADAVAQVGDNYYTTVQAAFAAAAGTNGTVTLLDDVTVTEAVKLAEGTVTLTSAEGAKYTLTGTGLTTISINQNGAALKVENVTVENTYNETDLGAGVKLQGVAIMVEYSDTSLTIADPAEVRATGLGGAAISSSGTLKILGGTVIATGSGGTGVSFNSGTAKVEGGTISGAAKGLNINSAVDLTPADTVLLTGGTFTGTTGDAILIKEARPNTLGDLVNAGSAIVSADTQRAVDMTGKTTGSGTFTVGCGHASVENVTSSGPDENGVVTVTAQCTKCSQEVTLGTLTMVNDGLTIAYGDTPTLKVQPSEELGVTKYEWPNNGSGAEYTPNTDALSLGTLTFTCKVTFADQGGTSHDVDVTFTLNVEKLNITNAKISVIQESDASNTVPYNGQGQKPAITGFLINGNGFSSSYFDVSLVDASGNPAEGKNAGTYKIKLTGKDVLEGTQTLDSPVFVIEKATPTIEWAAGTKESHEYAGGPVAIERGPTVTLVEGETYSEETHGKITYSYATAADGPYTEGLPKDVGTYYIKAAIAEQKNYTRAETEETLTLTIQKAATTVTPPATANPAYNGKPQALITSAWTNAGEGAVQYALSADGPWSTSIPTATAPGEYTVWYKVDETANYTGVEARSVTAKIEKATVTAIGPSLMVKNNLEKTYTLDLRPYLPTLPQGQEYGELTYTLTEVYIGDSDYIAENTVNLVDTVLTVPVNKVDKTVEGFVAAITVTIQSDNFQDICLTVSVTATNKTPLIITGVTAQGWTYDGTVHPGYTGTPRAEGYTGEFQVYYLGYLANGKNRKDAGTFCVEFVPVGSGYAGELSLTYTVEPAQVTVKADNKTAYVGEEMPELTYQVVSGLAAGESLITEPIPACDADMTKAGSYPITITGGEVPDGGNYKAEIVYQNGTLTVEEKSAPTPPTGGDKPSQGDKPSGGSSSGGSGGSTPSTPPVTTGKTTEGSVSVTETTAKPSATTRGDTASATVSSSVGSEIVKQAEKNKSDNVVIAPEIRGDVTRTEVSIPAKTVEQISSKTQASLTVSTPVADVTIPNEALSGLSESGGSVKVMAERTGNTVELSVTAGGKAVDSVPGGVTVTVPVKEAKPSTVAVLVREDGTRQLIRKSIAGEAGMTVPLEGSAKIEIIDNSKTFDDVPAESWKADAAAFASARELFHGTAPGQFSPDIPMSRGMLAVVLHNLESNPNAALTGVFTDVDNRQWYAEGVAWAAANGIVSGYGSGRFGPDDPITREQLAVILWRYAGRPAATEKELSFTDADQASGYALDALRWAVENGIINGKSGSTLDPKGPTTRAEAAQMLKNFLGK